jgi:branched-chain amino acid transport system permease protein
VRDNPERAEFLGYNQARVRYISFCASGFFAGIAGGLFAINYEILTEENLNLVMSGTILLAAFLGGVGFFIGPIVGAIVFTLLQTVLSLHTGLWQLYAGILFVTTVMFFPFGMTGLIAMHFVPYKLGRLGMLVVPYIKCLVPGLVCVIGTAGFVETLHHAKHASVGDSEVRVFWSTFDTSSALPWVIFGVMMIGGFFLARRTSPELLDTWAYASNPEADT